VSLTIGSLLVSIIIFYFYIRLDFDLDCLNTRTSVFTVAFLILRVPSTLFAVALQLSIVKAKY
jgi:hypothetical protein